MTRSLRATPGRTAFLLALTLATAPAHARAPSTDGADPDVQFTTGRESGPIPFELVGNHVYVRARVNDSPPLWFLLDTGATASYLDTGQAIALGIEPHGGVADHIMLRLPGVDLQMPHLRLMPITFRKYDGHDVSGLLGYDFFTHFVVAIDYAARSLSLRAPGAGDVAVEGERLQLTLLEDDSGGKVPLVSARITQVGRPPVAGRFILDTGARMALVLNTPYVAAHTMLEAVPRTITVTVGGGAMVRDLRLPIGRVDQLEIGGISIPKPLVAFSQDTVGILTATEFDGVIGGELLRRFRVVLDYSHQAVFLEPTAALAEPFEHDMSGLFVIEDGTGHGRLRVREVLERSPASEAGLKVGDVILSIDRTPAARLTLDRLRQRLRADRTALAVRVRRGSAVIHATIRLRRLI